QKYGTWRLHCNFPLPGSLSGHNSESSEQVVENLICDRQIPTTNKRSLPGKSNVVLTDPGQEFRIGHQLVNHNPAAPSFRCAIREPILESANWLPSQMDFRFVLNQRQGSNEIFQTAAMAERLRKPMDGR